MPPAEAVAEVIAKPVLVPEKSQDLPESLDLEWLLTDGRGGYAAGTPCLCPTRRYHGLLVSAFPGTAKRHVFLSRFDERLDGEPLGVARYGDSFAPRGDRALVDFESTPWPKATYEVAGARISREIRMVRGSRSVLVRYQLIESDGPRSLELRPLLPFREADALTIANDAADDTTEELADGSLAWRLYPALPRVALSSTRALEVDDDPTWYRGLSFEADEERGYEGGSDELSPVALRVTLERGESVTLAVTIEESAIDPVTLWRKTAAISKKRGKQATTEDRLESVAPDFLYEDDHGRSGVIAGFPWFGEWGRDTFLALPGLTLARGKRKECEKVLLGALPFLKDGLLPNVFGTDVDDSHYGSADAALWFARAVLEFDRAGGARRVLERKLLPALEAIAESYLEGTRLGLRFDDDGILHAGSPELNPTWMDAQTHLGPVTPRHGAPVEIAALGYSLIAHLAEAYGEDWIERRRKAGRAFLERFWLEDDAYLADVWREGGRDVSVRPNMILAAALEFSPLSIAQRAAVVERVRAELLTPHGLRTLSPKDAAYVGRYEGDPFERDSAYHQGTVWPWPLGFYTEACLRAAGSRRKRESNKLRDELGALWTELEFELDRAGLGHVSEVFDGDKPRRPGGTFAQAWNTAEWLRARALPEQGLPG